MAFRGHYEHSLDAKHRLSIPARFRAAFSDPVSFWPRTPTPASPSGPPTSTRPPWRRALEGKNPLGAEYKRIQRFFNSNSFETELDSAGRVILPAALREHAGIDKDVVVAGVGDHLEIWAGDRWDAEQAALDGTIGEVTEALGDPS